MPNILDGKDLLVVDFIARLIAQDLFGPDNRKQLSCLKQRILWGRHRVVVGLLPKLPLRVGNPNPVKGKFGLHYLFFGCEVSPM